MKNIISILGLILMTLTLVSCQKEDANKDVELAIAKLDNFNTTFAEMYDDEVISRDTLEGEENSEYDKLKRISTEYYEMINKMNSNVAEEAEKIEKGKNPKKVKGYTEAYEAATEAHKAAIDEAYFLFEANMMLISDEVIEEEVEIDDIDIIEIDSTEIEEVVDPSEEVVE